MKSMTICWRPAVEKPSAEERIILLRDDALQPQTFKTVMKAFQKRHMVVTYIAAPGLRSQNLPRGSENAGEIKLGNHTLTICRIPQAQQRSIKFVGDIEFEAPGHLEGRARWFKSRREGKD